MTGFIREHNKGMLRTRTTGSGGWKQFSVRRVLARRKSPSRYAAHIIVIMTSASIYPFKDDVLLVEKFEETLAEHGLMIPNGSTLEDACLELSGVYNVWNGTWQSNNLNFDREMWRRVVGLGDFMRKVLSVASHVDFKHLLPHISLLLDPAAGIIQNAKGRPTDQSTQKLFELYVAIWCLKIGTDLTIDSPSHSLGDNPDILFTSQNGVRWGIACKMLNTSKSKTYLDRLIEGIEQVEKSEAQRGIVCFNLKNVFDHDEMLPLQNGKDGLGGTFVHWPNDEFAQWKLTSLNPFDNVQLVEAAGGTRNIVDMFYGKKSVSAALELMSCICGVTGRLTDLRTLALRQFCVTDLETVSLIENLNRSLQDR